MISIIYNLLFPVDLVLAIIAKYFIVQISHLNNQYRINGSEQEILPKKLNLDDVSWFCKGYSEAVQRGKAKEFVEVIEENKKWNSYKKLAKRIKIATILFFAVLLLLIPISFINQIEFK